MLSPKARDFSPPAAAAADDRVACLPQRTATKSPVSIHSLYRDVQLALFGVGWLSELAPLTGDVVFVGLTDAA
jgi:hypothetical protein